ncbi:hypothetical protein [Neobacillus ginsengisoli]|uniref:VCBS repeat-containing protein n=1 Tax=Neobacillus ginsengisoli TaxID=904295 RepID=A0ABT9XTX5_9BACI|nr:hypothetical protein [Neobacillus ginsengisoli]MDQ0198969.1 hypothetical protein [Neobacillus ginsengisoli]
MFKRIFAGCFLILSVFPHERSYAIDRVVLNSVPIDKSDMRIYLLADKKSWMDYENFVVQVGEQGQGVLYHFPGWYHGKYDTALFYVDVSGDKQKDIVVILNNDRAGLGKPFKDIHILNQKHDLLFEESPVESVRTILGRLAKIEKYGNIVTIRTGRTNIKSTCRRTNTLIHANCTST